jgi:NADPH:quinone reductase-like Zn-dependent oxidoreductase
MPWHAFFTVDLIISVANKTILHPFFAWMLPLCLRAVTIPYSHISFQATAAYASLLTLLSVLSLLNHRVAFGLPREVDLSEEVIVITGGASGLGLLIADFYRMKGASVAVLDVKKTQEEELGGIQHYECNVGNAKAVDLASKRIREDVRRNDMSILRRNT